MKKATRKNARRAARKAVRAKARVTKTNKTKVSQRRAQKQTRKAVKAISKPAKASETAAGDSDGGTRTRAKKGVMVSIQSAEEVAAAITNISANDNATNYLKKNVSKRALDVITKLATPKTDEVLAEELGMKINAVRRILNILQGYGVTNYYVAKNVNGWLSFAWYINVSKLPPFFEYVNTIENKRPLVNSECNDYFMCNACYDKTKLVFTFDAAFEDNFRCNSCGKGLKMMDRGQAMELINNTAAQERVEV